MTSADGADSRALAPALLAAAAEVEAVPGYQMSEVIAPPTPGSDRRWSDRGNGLAAWLMSEWEREQDQDPNTTVAPASESSAAAALTRRHVQPLLSRSPGAHLPHFR